MIENRRSFLKYSGLASLTGAVAGFTRAAGQPAPEKADYTLRIGTGLVELGPEHIVSTTLYNGQFPGPLLRFKEGQRVVVDIYNDTDTPELVHWHGQIIQRCRRGGGGRIAVHTCASNAPDCVYAEALWFPLLSHPRCRRSRPESRHLHRAGRGGLH